MLVTTATGSPSAEVSTLGASALSVSHWAMASMIGVGESSPPRLGMWTSSRVSSMIDAVGGASVSSDAGLGRVMRRSVKWLEALEDVEGEALAAVVEVSDVVLD